MNWIKHLFGSAQPAGGAASSEKSTPASLRKRYGALYRPALHLRPTSAGGFSRLGGLPLMPADFEWPRWQEKPQSFLAQIDLAEVHQVMPSCLPATGSLFFFYDQDQGVWGI